MNDQGSLLSCVEIMNRVLIPGLYTVILKGENISRVQEGSGCKHSASEYSSHVAESASLRGS